MLCLLLRFACIFPFVDHITYAVLIRCQVLSIPHICPPDPVGEMRPRVGVVALLLGAAVVDTVVEYDCLAQIALISKDWKNYNTAHEFKLTIKQL